MQLKKFFKTRPFAFRPVLIALFFVIGLRAAHAGDEKTNSRIGASQIATGNYLYVTENKYSDPLQMGTALVRSSVGRVSLALDKYATTLNYFASPAFYIKVGVSITYFDISGTSSTITRDLIIDRQATGTSGEKFDVVIKDVHGIAK